MPGGNKCSGCNTRVKQHKFGSWGPSCNGPPRGGSSDDEKPGDVMDQLRVLTKRLKNLELAQGGNGAQKRQDYDEDIVDFESMSREQMLVYIKNNEKSKEKLAPAAQLNSPPKNGKKQVKFGGGEPRKRGLSISNLFDDEYLRGQD